jgi:protein O-mannosyl-transferase
MNAPKRRTSVRVSSAAPEETGAARWQEPAFVALLVVVAGIAYHNTFGVPFLFDDIESIVENPSIRSLVTALSPPAASGITVSGRPLLNLSLALNFAAGGLDVRGYHAVNLALHIAAGLLLFGLVRRTLELIASRAGGGASGDAPSGMVGAPAVGPVTDRARTRTDEPRRVESPGLQHHAVNGIWLAAAVSLLWIAHPLNTESVTYVVQRAESLVAVFLLLTLYACARAATSARPLHWQVLAVVSCALGMTSKEVMVSAPLLVLLYDRTFVAGTFGDAWKRRKWFHLALASTWLLLAASIWTSAFRGGTTGFAGGVTWWNYALTQCRAIVHYLRLSVWPHPLVFDHGTAVVTDPLAVAPHFAVLVALVAATLWALRRSPMIGFAGACFFAILAPTSSVVPVATQTVAEHRMYLPLAAVLTLVVLALHATLARHRAWFAGAVVVAATALAVTTLQRNSDYTSAESIWRDTMDKNPANPRAPVSLGNALVAAGRAAEALPLFERALQLDPNHVKAHGALGNALLALGRAREAVPRLEEALRLQPDEFKTLSNLGNALLAAGRFDEAIARQREALRLAPTSVETRHNLAVALARAGRPAEAVEELRTTLRQTPDYAAARLTLANTLVLAGKPEAAIEEYRALLADRPDMTDAWSNLGFLLAHSGRTAEAIRCYEELLRRAPGHAEARAMLQRLGAATSSRPTPLPDGPR